MAYFIKRRLEFTLGLDIRADEIRGKDYWERKTREIPNKVKSFTDLICRCYMIYTGVDSEGVKWLMYRVEVEGICAEFDAKTDEDAKILSAMQCHALMNRMKDSLQDSLGYPVILGCKVPFMPILKTEDWGDWSREKAPKKTAVL